jgi:hypothetical protein
VKHAEQEVWVPSGDLAAGFDAALWLIAANEVEGEAADDNHVLGPVALSVAREVVLEGDVEEPVHALDAPVATSGLGEALDVEGGGGEIGSGLGGGLAGLFGDGVDLDEGGDAGEARGAGIVAVGGDPADVAGGEIGAVSMRPWPFSTVVVVASSSPGAVRK